MYIQQQYLQSDATSSNNLLSFFWADIHTHTHTHNITEYPYNENKINYQYYALSEHKDNWEKIM